MSKRTKHTAYEFDDEFYAQLDFLRKDYDDISKELEQAKKDNRRLIALLIEKDIPVPRDMLNRYVRKITEDDEELPFN